MDRYGHEAKYRAVFEQLYGLSWKRHVELGQEGLLAAGYSCHSQVKRLEEKALMHTTQALLAALAGPDGGESLVPIGIETTRSGACREVLAIRT